MGMEQKPTSKTPFGFILLYTICCGAGSLLGALFIAWLVK